MLKKIWPTPYKIDKGNLVSFLVQLIIFVVLTTVVGWLIGVLAKVPVAGIIFGLIGALMEVYTVVGIVLCILRFVGALKD